MTNGERFTLDHRREWVPRFKKFPRWRRSAAQASDGTVFVPAIIAGNEESVLLCAAFDGVPLVTDEGHVYVPASWMMQEYPKTRDVCTVIAAKFGVTP